MQKLRSQLRNIDGKSYKGYKSLQGNYQFQSYKLAIDYVQGDPFASPSKIRLIIPDKDFPIKKEWIQSKQRKIYTEDVIARHIARAIRKNQATVRGSGKSGLLSIDAPGQEILERTAVTTDGSHTTICLSVGLPANGRRINGREAEKLFFQIIPDILKQSVFSIKNHDIEAVVQLADQQEVIREKMKENNWIAFVADGAILPRESGISNRPLKKAVPFQSPEENRVSIELPHRDEPLTGMALKQGITVIVGGGYHGKSTLLTAIERGVYHHIKGDGREYVLTDSNAVKVRAEDGRKVTNVNISPFINNLPHGEDTMDFSTENASGSTSQATNVMEALEAGASTLLIDEDTSATNFMIRDQRMQELVVKEKEPITPFIDKISQLRDELNVSTVLVMGGSGDYFDAADQVIMLDEYIPHNVTQKAKGIASQFPSERKHEDESFGTISDRVLLPESLDSRKGKKSKVQAKGLDKILMGKVDIDLQQVEQLVDVSQTRMIAQILHHLEQKGWLKQKKSLSELLDEIEKQMDTRGLPSFTPRPNEHPGELARPRRFEIAATLNRLRTAKGLSPHALKR
ncbi:ABC-ATPase domain-containing protein [Virgibacillus sp. MSP4-1]|uniref:ABC-ATPase domain-containing protein n=1 Tax=Virgibacillus sp. MSP4-1 TaxID=2700081 RepID=UPI0003A7DCA3|nr:ABC-ATPase domain-containing protein [Virgibacillus sp. MSP4-1]QHS21525.1 ABC-ATPase domain-containing protein [Virgibacillus sp. MSP4-1]